MAAVYFSECKTGMRKPLHQISGLLTDSIVMVLDCLLDTGDHRFAAALSLVDLEYFLVL